MRWVTPAAKALCALTILLALVSPAHEGWIVVIVFSEWALLGALYAMRSLMRRLAERARAARRSDIDPNRAQATAARRWFLVLIPIVWLRIPFYLLFFANLYWLNRAEKHWYEELPYLTARDGTGWTFVGLMPVKGVHLEYTGIVIELPGLGNLHYRDPDRGVEGTRADRRVFGNWWTEWEN